MLQKLFGDLDTPGGHMVICLFVIGLGATFSVLRIPKGEDLIIAGSSTLFLAMRGRGTTPDEPEIISRHSKIETETESRIATPESPVAGTTSRSDKT